MADFANGGICLGPKIRHFRGFTVNCTFEKNYVKLKCRIIIFFQQVIKNKLVIENELHKCFKICNFTNYMQIANSLPFFTCMHLITENCSKNQFESVLLNHSTVNQDPCSEILEIIKIYIQGVSN